MARPSKDTIAKAKEKGLIGVYELGKELGISRRTIGRLCRMKELEYELIDGQYYFDPNMIQTLTNIDPDTLQEDRDFVLQYALETLESQTEHINELIKLSHKPAQDTIQALMQENNALRARARESEKTVVEVHELYGQLLRQTMLTELEAEREKDKMKMKQDAFALLKEKIVPMMLDGLGTKKFIESFSDTQIEAFIESGAASAEQVVALKKELVKRKKKGTSNAPHTEKPGEKPVSDSTVGRPGGGDNQANPGS